jgi:hypothetical protein
VVQALFVQVWPLAQQTPPHRVWPAVGQAQVPFWQVVPPEQALPQVPQLAALELLGHAPPAHGATPAPQSAEQELLLHTIVPEQATPQLPQLAAVRRDARVVATEQTGAAAARPVLAELAGGARFAASAAVLGVGRDGLARAAAVRLARAAGDARGGRRGAARSQHQTAEGEGKEG